MQVITITRAFISVVEENGQTSKLNRIEGTGFGEVAIIAGKTPSGVPCHDPSGLILIKDNDNNGWRAYLDVDGTPTSNVNYYPAA